jgi:F420-dependent oxidoreductase-like protein
MRVKFGVHIGPQNIEMAELRRLWRWADTAGFDWVSVWDHFYEAPHLDRPKGCFEATALMAAIACETSNVRVGALVLGIPYRNPGVLAKALLTVDHLSGGRLDIGLGGGWHEPEFSAFGIPYPPIKERLDMLEEGVQVVRLLMTEERSRFAGKHYQLNDAAFFPRPVQARVPITVGGTGERRTLRIAARHADAWNAAYIETARFARLNGVLDEWCGKEGRDPATIERTINLSFHMAAGPSHVEAANAGLHAAWGPGASRFENGGAVIGLPSQAIDLVGQLQDARAARVTIALRPPLDWDALHAWANEVMPAFRR